MKGKMLYQGSLSKVSVLPKSWTEYRSAWSKSENRDVLTAHPLHLDIELTSQCNLRCEMCWQNGLMVEDVQGMMKDHVFKKVVDEGIPLGLSAIKLQSRGESTLHPRLAKLARYAKDAGIRDIQLTTNGTLMTKKNKLKELMECGLDKLIFSVDPQHDESAEEIYKGNVPDIAKIVHEAIQIKESLGSETPVIRIQSIPDPGQSKEVKLEELRQTFPKADEYMVNELWDADTSDDFSEDLSLTHEMLPCSYLWTRVVVFWNGEIGLCCRDYNNVHKLGNAEFMPITEIWQGDHMMELRKAHLDGKRGETSVCKNCEMGIRKKEAIDENPFIYITSEREQSL